MHISPLCAGRSYICIFLMVSGTSQERKAGLPKLGASRRNSCAAWRNGLLASRAGPARSLIPACRSPP